MKILNWLKSIKKPSAESTGGRSSYAREEKIYRPLINTQAIEPDLDNTRPRKTDSRPKSFKEQRRYRRYSTPGQNVQAKMVLSEEVNIENISIGGACIHTKKLMKPGEKILININDKDIDHPLKCKVVWENNGPADRIENNSAYYQTGVQFHDVPSYTLIRLKDFMRESGVPDMKKLSDQYLPSSLRFKIYRNQKAFLKYPSTCPVKKISLGGMLIETDRKYAVEERYPVAVYLSDKTSPIRCIGRIASQLPVSDTKTVRYDTGVEFFKLEDHDRLRLRNFISEL